MILRAGGNGVDGGLILWWVLKLRGEGQGDAVKRYRLQRRLRRAVARFVLFPYDTDLEFGAKGKVPVKATLECMPYTGSLMNATGGITCWPW